MFKIIIMKVKEDIFTDADDKLVAFFNRVFRQTFETEPSKLLNEIISKFLSGCVFILPRYFFKFHKDLELIFRFNEEIDKKTLKIVFSFYYHIY